MNKYKYDTGNYNYCIKNATAVWNLTPLPANIPAALIPQQHVIHQTSNKVDITDIRLSLCVNF